MTKRVLSFTKGGGIYVPPCDDSRLLFSPDVEPSSWPSCNDAGEYTWSMPQEDLSAITSTDRLKLSRSMGFCPHDRCQLGNLTNALVDGQCPQNLCYTKLENGGRSYGACCFIDNKFNSGQLIGYYDKTQHAPKPIYKRSRVILGDEIGGSDETYESFINANQIHPSIIATQCPLYNTVEDVLRMLVEQNISLWIQLAPFADSTNSSHASQCKMREEVFAQTSLALNSSYVGIKNIQKKARMQYGLTQATFSVDTFEAELTMLKSSSHNKRSSNKYIPDDYYEHGDKHHIAHPLTGSSTSTISDTTQSDPDTNSVVRTQQVTNVWYNNWRDFDVPAPADEQVCFLFGLCLVLVCPGRSSTHFDRAFLSAFLPRDQIHAYYPGPDDRRGSGREHHQLRRPRGGELSQRAGSQRHLLRAGDRQAAVGHFALPAGGRGGGHARAPGRYAGDPQATAFRGQDARTTEHRRVRGAVQREPQPGHTRVPQAPDCTTDRRAAGTGTSVRVAAEENLAVWLAARVACLVRVIIFVEVCVRRHTSLNYIIL